MIRDTLIGRRCLGVLLWREWAHWGVVAEHRHVVPLVAELALGLPERCGEAA